MTKATIGRPPPCSWVERDEVAVEVYTEDGDDAEAAEWLKKMLN